MTADEESARPADLADAAGSPAARACVLPWLTASGHRPVRRAIVAVVVVSYAWLASAGAPFSTRALVGV